jgi:hypothetical protein
MAVRTRTTNATETARKMLEDNRGQEACTRAIGFALVGLSDQIAHLIGIVEAEQADHEEWRKTLNHK